MRLHLTLLLALVSPGVAMAQAMVQPLPGSSDADLLAATMRRVAANPLDLDALLTAGEQSLRVDDNAGAASLFARAEKIDPRNGRVKAGMAAILVRSERPGEALRFFQQAEAAGLDPRRYAADRGLAFDLVGEQARAQRDYRLALTAGPDDETTRRLALSLGISGQRDQALKLLDPLLGRTDRGAWRARAFILAMTGDQDGATKIAGTMMPGVATGLRPFFQRLPSLSPTDRAFAVHFGEVRATPERIADARLIPQFPPLTPDARPVQVAAVRTTAPQPTRAQSRRQEREARRRRGRDEGRVTLASAATGVPATAAVVAPPAAPALRVATLLPTGAAPVPVAAAPTRLATVDTAPRPAPRDSVVMAVSTGGLAPLLPSTPGASVVRPVEAASLSPASPTSSAPTASVTLASTMPVSTAPLPTAAVSTAPISTPSVTSAAPTTLAAVPGGTATPPRTASAVEAAMPRPAADSVLARIVASLVIPASELGVEGPTRVVGTSTTEGATRTVEAVRTKAARDAEAGEVAERLSGVPAKPPVTLTRAERRAAAEKKAAELKAAADKKAAAAKLAEEKRVARTNPQRIWVQVAGGAFAGDLPKAYAAVKKKAPDVFGARAGYSAKLRATNRVLTGPFKTDAEARAFVNQLARAGVSAFPFTSDPGEAVTKLPAR